MFIGHIAVGVAAKRVAPHGSLGTYVAGAMFLDVLWPIFLLLGIERVAVAPGITAFCPFDFTYYPWSHSLFMAAIYAVLIGFFHFMVRYDATTAKVLGAVVFSHWVLDFVTHRPDLPLAPWCTTRVGLGLWRSVPGTLIVEGSMFWWAVLWYGRATRATDATGRWAWLSFVGVLVVMYLGSLGPPPPPGHEKLIALVTIAAGVIIPWAAWIDRHRVFR